MYSVLIVDDEEIIREGIGSLIDWDALGFVICGEGIDGKDGLAKIMQYNPDLVLLDLRMPGLDGAQVINRARDRNFRGHFILMTGHTEIELAQAALPLGIHDYLVKPIDDEELLRIIGHFLVSEKYNTM